MNFVCVFEAYFDHDYFRIFRALYFVGDSALLNSVGAKTIAFATHVEGVEYFAKKYNTGQKCKMDHHKRDYCGGQLQVTFAVAAKAGYTSIQFVVQFSCLFALFSSSFYKVLLRLLIVYTDIRRSNAFLNNGVRIPEGIFLKKQKNIYTKSISFKNIKHNRITEMCGAV